MNATTKDATAPSTLASLAGKPSHIAVMRALRLGDLLCAVPALRALRAALPLARITLIGLPLAHEFVRRCPFVDDFEEFPGYPGIADQPVDPQRALAFLAKMQATHLDLAIQLHGSGVFSNPFTRLLGARRTVGFTREGETDLGLDFAIPYPQHGREVDRLLLLMHALGAPAVDDQLEFAILPEDVAELMSQNTLQHLLAGRRPIVGLHPGASVATRRWLPDRFAAVGDAIAMRYSARVIILGNADERATCEEVRRQMRSPALNLAGHTSLGVVAALLARMRLLVANDSGLAHLSIAVGTPAVVIFGAAQAETWAQRDRTRCRWLSVSVPCRPCALRTCPIGYMCLTGVSVEAVVAEATDILDNDADTGTNIRTNTEEHALQQ